MGLARFMHHRILQRPVRHVHRTGHTHLAGGAVEGDSAKFELIVSQRLDAFRCLSGIRHNGTRLRLGVLKRWTCGLVASLGPDLLQRRKGCDAEKTNRVNKRATSHS